MVWITNNTLNNSLLPHYIKSAVSLLLLCRDYYYRLTHEWMEQRNSALATYLAHCQCLIVFYIEGVYWSFVRRPVCWCNALSICGLLWCDNNKKTGVERFFSCGMPTGWRRDWDRRFWSSEESACLSGEERKFVLAVSRGRFDIAARCNSVFGRAPAALR